MGNGGSFPALSSFVLLLYNAEQVVPKQDSGEASVAAALDSKLVM
jgi:hypothetical protein